MYGLIFNNVDFVNFRALVFWWRKNINCHESTKSLTCLPQAGLHQMLIDNSSGKYYKILSF
jgi:hypothetical protein